MNITGLNLVNIRSYEERAFTFSPYTTVIYGPNGAGKTNIVEALYIGTMGMSHRTTNLKDVLRFGASTSSITIDFTKHGTPHTIVIGLSETGRKEIRLNSNRITQKELIGTLNTVIFSPEDLDLIKGTPGARRRFLDGEISQTSAQYYQQLSMYTKALKQRNRILQEGAGRLDLEDWDEQIASLGAKIVKRRLEALKKLNMLMVLMNRKLTGGLEDLKAVYSQPYTDTLCDTKEGFMALLEAHREQDRRRGHTSVGPHRDDLLFMAGSMDLKRFGSQGQQRTAILSVKLSELEFIKSEVGEYPVLLLDDVLSELDEDRRQNLLKFIHKRVQTFITTTHKDEVQSLAADYIAIEKVKHE